MAEQPTPEQLEKLAKQQQKFNEELSKTEGLLESIGTDIGKNIKDSLNTVINKANDLNVAFGTGKDISKTLGEEQIKISAKIETLERRLRRTRNEGEVERLSKAIALFRRIQSQLLKTEQIVEEEKKITEEKKKQIELEKRLDVSLKRRLGLIKNIYGELLVGFKYAIDAGFKANNQIVSLGKSLGISEDSAREIRNNFQQFVNTSQDGFISVERLFKAQSELTDQLGFAVKFSKEELETFSRLTNIIGLSTQEASNLVKFSSAFGKEVNKYEGDLLKSAFYTQQATKSHFSAKQILQDASKLSAGILVKFQGNPEALGKAVVQAKTLGTTLEQIDKTAESLLNFESSIENELKAELITGRQLNFERARAAALTGDQAELMQEVASQVGTLEDFNKLNVIAQKSLADAFGMSRDDLADMLIKQEAINKYGDEAAKLNAEQLKYMKENGLTAAEMLDKVNNQRSAQEKFNDAMERLQGIIGGIVEGPLGQFAGLMAKILSSTIGAYSFLGLYIARMGTLIALKLAEYSITKKNVAANITGAAAEAAKSAAMTPIIGWGLAAAAALAIAGALYGLSKQEVKDGMAPASRGPFTITDSFGATAITTKGDNLAVSPNFNKGGGMDVMPLIAAVNEVKAAIGALANKPVPAIALNVDGQKLGEVVGRRPETGTNQYQNSYRLA